MTIQSIREIRFAPENIHVLPSVITNGTSAKLRRALTVVSNRYQSMQQLFMRASEYLRIQLEGCDECIRNTSDRFFGTLQIEIDQIAISARDIFGSTQRDLKQNVEIRFAEDRKNLQKLKRELKSLESRIKLIATLPYPRPSVDTLIQYWIDSFRTLAEKFGLRLEELPVFSQQLAKLGISLERMSLLVEELFPGRNRSEAQAHLIELATRAGLLRAPLSLEGLWELTEMGTFADMNAELAKLEADDRALLQPSLTERLGFTERKSLVEFLNVLHTFNLEISLEEYACLMERFKLSSGELLDLGIRASMLSPPCSLQALAEQASATTPIELVLEKHLAQLEAKD